MLFPLISSKGHLFCSDCLTRGFQESFFIASWPLTKINGKSFFLLCQKRMVTIVGLVVNCCCVINHPNIQCF